MVRLSFESGTHLFAEAVELACNESYGQRALAASIQSEFENLVLSLVTTLLEHATSGGAQMVEGIVALFCELHELDNEARHSSV